MEASALMYNIVGIIEVMIQIATDIMILLILVLLFLKLCKWNPK